MKKLIIAVILLSSCTVQQPVFKVNAGYSKYFVYPNGQTLRVGEYQFDKVDCPQVNVK